MSETRALGATATTFEIPPRAGAARWALAALSLAMLMSSLGTSIANVALPTFAEAFAASFQAVQWVVLAYLLAITTLIVSVGRLGDIFGHRRIMLAGILLFTAASLLCGLAPTLPLLVVARGVQGAGAAILMTLTVVLVRECVPAERTGSAMGLLGTMSAVGTALGPSLGGVLIATMGWPSIFLVNLPLGIVAFWLAWRSLPADRAVPGKQRPGLDPVGTALLALALGAYALAMTGGAGHVGVRNLALLGAAAAAGGLFVLAQKKVASPLIRLEALRQASLGTSLAMNALVSTVMMATLVVGPFYLSQAVGLDPANVGAVMAIGPIISALSGLPAGRIVDRMGPQSVILLGLIAMLAGAIGLTVLPAMFATAGYITAIAVLTPGYQLFQAANNTLVMTNAETDRRGVASGMLSLSRNLGLITGASAMGSLFAYASMSSDIAAAAPEAVAAGMRITFMAAALLILVAGILAVTSCLAAAGPRR